MTCINTKLFTVHRKTSFANGCIRYGYLSVCPSHSAIVSK